MYTYYIIQYCTYCPYLKCNAQGFTPVRLALLRVALPPPPRSPNLALGSLKIKSSAKLPRPSKTKSRCAGVGHLEGLAWPDAVPGDSIRVKSRLDPGHSVDGQNICCWWVSGVELWPRSSCFINQAVKLQFKSQKGITGPVALWVRCCNLNGSPEHFAAPPAIYEEMRF